MTKLIPRERIPLLIIPGIIKYYEYLPVPWLLAKHPEKPASGIFHHGRFIMRGMKYNAFLTLSR